MERTHAVCGLDSCTSRLTSVRLRAMGTCWTLYHAGHRLGVLSCDTCPHMPNIGDTWPRYLAGDRRRFLSSVDGYGFTTGRSRLGLMGEWYVKHGPPPCNRRILPFSTHCTAHVTQRSACHSFPANLIRLSDEWNTATQDRPFFFHERKYASLASLASLQACKYA